MVGHALQVLGDQQDAYRRRRLTRIAGDVLNLRVEQAVTHGVHGGLLGDHLLGQLRVPRDHRRQRLAQHLGGRVTQLADLYRKRGGHVLVHKGGVLHQVHRLVGNPLDVRRDAP